MSLTSYQLLHSTILVSTVGFEPTVFLFFVILVNHSKYSQREGTFHCTMCLQIDYFCKLSNGTNLFQTVIGYLFTSNLRIDKATVRLR